MQKRTHRSERKVEVQGKINQNEQTKGNKSEAASFLQLGNNARSKILQDFIFPGQLQYVIACILGS